MRFKEKKCPNCGADLEFSETDKTCKCQYCKRSFEIERDMSDIEKFNLVYDKIHKPMKMMFIIPLAIFCIVFIFFVLLAIGSMKKQDINDTSIFEEYKDLVVDKENLLTDVSELKNRDFDIIDSQASSQINRIAEGVNDANHSFSVDGDITREKLYVLSGENYNKLVIIFKATYKDFFHQENRHTIYIPVSYENIEKDVISSLGNSKVTDHIYYLSSDQSCFTYGYSSFDEAYQATIASYTEDYKITEK